MGEPDANNIPKLKIKYRFITEQIAIHHCKQKIKITTQNTKKFNPLK